MATETLEIQLEQLVTFSGNIYEVRHEKHYIIIWCFLFLLDAIHDLGGQAGSERSPDPDRGELLIDLFVHELTEIEVELLKTSLPDDLKIFFNLLKRLQDIKNNKIKESVMTPGAMKEPVLYLREKPLSGEDENMIGEDEHKLGTCVYVNSDDHDYISVYFNNIQPELNLHPSTGLSHILKDICSKLKSQSVRVDEDATVFGKLSIEDILNIILLFCFCNSTMVSPPPAKVTGRKRGAAQMGGAAHRLRNRNTIQNQIDLKFLAYEVHLIFKNPRNQFIGAGISNVSQATNNTSFISYLKEAYEAPDYNIKINFAVDTSIDAMSKMYTEAVKETDTIEQLAARAEAAATEAAGAAAAAAADSEELPVETAVAMEGGTPAEEAMDTLVVDTTPIPQLPPVSDQLTPGTTTAIMALRSTKIFLHEMFSSLYDTAGVIHRPVVEAIGGTAYKLVYYSENNIGYKLTLILKVKDFVILKFHLETGLHGEKLVVVYPEIEIWFNKSLTTLLSSISITEYNKGDKKLGVGVNRSIWHSQKGIVTIMEKFKGEYDGGYKNRSDEFLEKCKVHHYKTIQDFAQGLEKGARSAIDPSPDTFQLPPSAPFADAANSEKKLNLNFFSTGDKLCGILASIINKVVFLDNHRPSYKDGSFLIFGPKIEIVSSTQSSRIQFDRAQYYKELVEKHQTLDFFATVAETTRQIEEREVGAKADRPPIVAKSLSEEKLLEEYRANKVKVAKTGANALVAMSARRAGGKQFLTRRIRKRKQKITQRAKAKPKTKPKAKPKTRGKEKGRKKRTQKRHRKIQRRYKNKTKRLQREKKRTTRKK